MEPSAKIIADSYSPSGQRLTTMEVVFPRIVLAEFNTHRRFSRNSASSRAIPVEKQMAKVKKDPFIPLYWGKNQKGMQADQELTPDEQQLAERMWRDASKDMLRIAGMMADLGVHKQITNRLLEPFMWHTAIVTSTEWENFFTLRCSPLAMPEIRMAAEAMREAYDASDPEEIGWGGWHLPYITVDDHRWATRHRPSGYPNSVEVLKQISVARCCRVSYLTHDGVRDPEEDLALYGRLVSAKPMHASPLEHAATPCRGHVRAGEVHLGNFEGWDQLRHQVEGLVGI